MLQRVFEGLHNFFMSLLGVVLLSPSALTVVKLDEDGNLHLLGQQSRDIVISYPNRAVFYSQMQCPELGNVPQEELAYVMFMSEE